jgi:hypothetical protein
MIHAPGEHNLRMYDAHRAPFKIKYFDDRNRARWGKIGSFSSLTAI